MSRPSDSSHLDQGSLPMGILRDQYRTELGRLLNNQLSNQSSKQSFALVLDRSLTGLLNHLCDIEWLKQHGVSTMYYLQSSSQSVNLSNHLSASQSNNQLVEEIPSYVKHLCYLINPTISTIRLIDQQIKLSNSNSNNQSNHTFSMIATPRWTVLAKTEMENLNLHSMFQSISQLSIDLIPFEWDVLSLENNQSISQSNDQSINYLIARSIMRLQSINGLIPVIRGKGDQAIKVCQLIVRLKREMHSLFKGTEVLADQSNQSDSQPSNQPSNHQEYDFPPYHDIDELILIDRSVDSLTPFMSQLTYEGLIDECFSIKQSTIDVDANILGDQSTKQSDKQSNKNKQAKKKLLLTSADPVFNEIRDMSFQSISQSINQRLQSINHTFSQDRHSMSVTELQAYLSRFKQAHYIKQFLTVHVNLADSLSLATTKDRRFVKRVDIEKSILRGDAVEECEEFVDQLINQSANLVTILRLIALMSFCGGLRQKKYDQWKRDILLMYGFKHWSTIQSMEKRGWFSLRRRDFQTINRSMRLTSDYRSQSNNQSIVNIGYVYEGYAPLSVRLIEMGAVTVGGWRRMEDIMQQIPGQTFEINQLSNQPTNQSDRSTNGANGSTERHPKDPANTQPTNPSSNSSTKRSTNQSNNPSLNEDRKPLVLVYFIGGVTFAEISALRWLSERENHPKEYMVATTKIINGNTLIESLMD